MDEPALEEDRELLVAFRRGERPALARVFRRYAREVAAIVQRGVRVEVGGVVQRVGGDLSPWDLENAVQETFVKAFQPGARASYDGVRPFAAWLTVIARNVLIDRARKERRERAHVVFVDDVEVIAPCHDERSDPAREVAGQQLARVLQRFIASLSDDDRRLFAKRYEEQRSLRQAAKELEMGLFELRKRDARLRVALRDTLRAEGVGEHDDIRVGTSVLERRRATPEKEGA